MPGSRLSPTEEGMSSAGELPFGCLGGTASQHCRGNRRSGNAHGTDAQYIAAIPEAIETEGKIVIGHKTHSLDASYFFRPTMM